MPFPHWGQKRALWRTEAPQAAQRREISGSDINGVSTANWQFLISGVYATACIRKSKTQKSTKP